MSKKKYAINTKIIVKYIYRVQQYSRRKKKYYKYWSQKMESEKVNDLT